MFYTEEDVQPAVDIAAELFGHPGRLIDGHKVMRNTSIATRQFGKLWYGDIDTTSTDLEATCIALSQRIGQDVYVFSEDSNFNYNANNRYTSAP